MNTSFGWLFAISLLSVLVACGGEGTSEPPNPAETSDTTEVGDPSSTDPSRAELILGLAGDAENGAALYGLNCQACHGPDGGGGTAGTLLRGLTFTEALVISVLDGKNYMPAFGSFLTDQEIADLISHVESL